MSPKTTYLYFFFFMSFLFCSLLSGQRPDIVFLNDSSKLVGEIEILEAESPAIIYLIMDNEKQRLTAGEVMRFLQYDQKTGKKKLEAISLTATGESEAGFFRLISDSEKIIRVYQKINQSEYYLVQGNGSLVRIPDDEALLDFVRPMMGSKRPTINGQKISMLSLQKITRLTNFLESNSWRFPARSVGFTFSYYHISANTLTAGQLPNTTTLERISTDLSPPTFFNVRFEAPEKMTGQALIADAFAILPLSSSLKFDLKVSGGYGYKELTGLQEFGSAATFLDIKNISAFSGRAHLVRFGSELNYRMGGKKLLPFVSLGIGIETPIKQESILFNYLKIEEVVNTNLLHLESFQTTLFLPSYSVGVEVFLTADLWCTLEAEGGFEWSVIDSNNPYYGFSLSVNY